MCFHHSGYRMAVSFLNSPFVNQINSESLWPGVCEQYTATLSSSPGLPVSEPFIQDCALLYANRPPRGARKQLRRLWKTERQKTTRQGLEECLMYLSGVLAAENLLLLMTFLHTFQYFLFLHSTFIKLLILSWFHLPHTTQGMSLVSWNIFPHYQPQGHHQLCSFWWF